MRISDWSSDVCSSDLRTFNPGQLVIVREILADTTAGDTDIAVFSDLRANYDITNNDDGTISVAHARGTQLDGVDTLRNIERMRFSDIEDRKSTRLNSSH